jgi:hypothetical protein
MLYMRIVSNAPAVIVLAALAIGCTRTPSTDAQTSAQTSPFLPKASIRELMEAEVDPAADALWDSVQITLTAAGEEDRQPRTDEEWKAVRRSAVILVESTNLLVMEGRRIVAPGAQLPPGEADPAILQKRLDANRAPFIGFALALRGVSLQALEAIDAKDPKRLLEVGGDIDAACEACHLVYWYPPDLVKY